MHRISKISSVGKVNLSECHSILPCKSVRPFLILHKKIPLDRWGATPSFDLFPFKAKHSTGLDVPWGDTWVLISIHLRRNTVGASFSAEHFFIGFVSF